MNINDLSSILSNFVPISLEQMDHVKLLDRIDTKFIIHEDQVAEILTAVAPQYNILEIEGVSVHPYETLYFDTPGFHLYLMHHNGILNRYKIRCRKYVNSGLAFFELKFKTNTSRTIKKRMEVSDIPATLTEPLNKFIQEHTPDADLEFIPVLRVFFDRLTFVNINGNERLTIDVNLRYESNGVTKTIGNMVVAEIKQQKHSVSPFRQLMKLRRQHKYYMSKYCLGITCMNGGLKRNRFKQKYRILKKLGYDIH